MNRELEEAINTIDEKMSDLFEIELYGSSRDWDNPKNIDLSEEWQAIKQTLTPPTAEDIVKGYKLWYQLNNGENRSLTVDYNKNIKSFQHYINGQINTICKLERGNIVFVTKELPMDLQHEITTFFMNRNDK